MTPWPKWAFRNAAKTMLEKYAAHSVLPSHACVRAAHLPAARHHDPYEAYKHSLHCCASYIPGSAPWWLSRRGPACARACMCKWCIHSSNCQKLHSALKLLPGSELPELMHEHATVLVCSLPFIDAGRISPACAILLLVGSKHPAMCSTKLEHSKQRRMLHGCCAYTCRVAHGLGAFLKDAERAGTQRSPLEPPRSCCLNCGAVDHGMLFSSRFEGCCATHGAAGYVTALESSFFKSKCCCVE
eukprot:scaffold119944_cov17-Tisochrysis_lutea.AAC.1